jgi:hypothetical protein
MREAARRAEPVLHHPLFASIRVLDADRGSDSDSIRGSDSVVSRSRHGPRTRCRSPVTATGRGSLRHPRITSGIGGRFSQVAQLHPCHLDRACEWITPMGAACGPCHGVFPAPTLHRLAATTAPSLRHPREFSPHPPITDSRPPPLPPSATPASFPRTHPSQTRGHHRSLPPPPPRVRRPLGAGEGGRLAIRSARAAWWDSGALRVTRKVPCSRRGASVTPLAPAAAADSAAARVAVAVHCR